ncbi:MAG: hypothetical protein B6D71_08855 [gamma proteobacterium symbiont of Stewartia floridana]|nr:MAG: hypothetical protein B6D71_08855 [gamma proteobacterium symbiont of Stewartia floridana]
MSKQQKKLVEVWVIVIVLFIVVGIFQDNATIARAAFIPVVIYVLFNYREIRSLEAHAPTLQEIISKSKFMSSFGLVYLLLVIIGSFYFLFSGKYLGNYILDFWKLAFVFLCPIIIPIIISQKILYRSLSDKQL